MKMAKKTIALALAIMMVIPVVGTPVHSETSHFYYFPLVTESMGGSYMAAAVAIQKFLILFSSSYATRLMQCGGTDGFFGSESAAVTKLFQTGNGLTADGKVGSQTWLKIEAYLGVQGFEGDVGGVIYYLNGNSVYSKDNKVISYPYSNGYAAYDQNGNPTNPFYYP